MKCIITLDQPKLSISTAVGIIYSVRTDDSQTSLRLINVHFTSTDYGQNLEEMGAKQIDKFLLSEVS